MNCPKCHSHLDDTPARIVDTPTGIVAVVDHPTPIRRAYCICGWTYTIASTTSHTRQPELRLITDQGEAA